jgi:hypothetical protein
MSIFRTDIETLSIIISTSLYLSIYITFSGDFSQMERIISVSYINKMNPVTAQTHGFDIGLADPFCWLLFAEFYETFLTFVGGWTSES